VKRREEERADRPRHATMRAVKRREEERADRPRHARRPRLLIAATKGVETKPWLN